MTRNELYSTLKDRFRGVLESEGIGAEPLEIVCRSLTPEEAIGRTQRTDYPILTGKDVMIQAECLGSRGQAFTDAPASFRGTLSDVLDLDILNDPHGRGIFIAALNAVMRSLGRCSDTVHCRTDGPECCASDMKKCLADRWPHAKKITLVGYQPALLQMLAESGLAVRVLDLNPQNIGQCRYGITVEDGGSSMTDAAEWADLILCTGSTLCNGTMADYLSLDREVVFFGITAAGAASLLGLKRLCFADRYPG